MGRLRGRRAAYRQGRLKASKEGCWGHEEEAESSLHGRLEASRES